MATAPDLPPEPWTTLSVRVSATTLAELRRIAAAWDYPLERVTETALLRLAEEELRPAHLPLHPEIQAALDEADADIAAGRVLTSEQVQAEIDRWFAARRA